MLRACSAAFADAGGVSTWMRGIVVLQILPPIFGGQDNGTERFAREDNEGRSHDSLET
jgi:hypothetical protein